MIMCGAGLIESKSERGKRVLAEANAISYRFGRQNPIDSVDSGGRRALLRYIYWIRSLSSQQKDIIYARSLKAVWCSGKDLYGPELALAGAETVAGLRPATRVEPAV